MRHREYRNFRNREHHPMISVGLFFIVLGIALLVATNDVFNLGSVGSYFTWETALIFIGVLLLLNLQFTGGLFLIALGFWFLQERFLFFPSEQFKMFFWPSVIALVGLSFIFSSFFKRNKLSK